MRTKRAVLDDIRFYRSSKSHQMITGPITLQELDIDQNFDVETQLDAPKIKLPAKVVYYGKEEMVNNFDFTEVRSLECPHEIAFVAIPLTTKTLKSLNAGFMFSWSDT